MALSEDVLEEGRELVRKHDLYALMDWFRLHTPWWVDRREALPIFHRCFEADNTDAALRLFASSTMGYSRGAALGSLVLRLASMAVYALTAAAIVGGALYLWESL